MPHQINGRVLLYERGDLASERFAIDCERPARRHGVTQRDRVQTRSEAYELFLEHAGCAFELGALE